MNSFEVSMFISAVAELIADNYSEAEADVLGSMFNQLGDTINTATAIRALGANDNEEKGPATDPFSV